jgi:hypothetical protein
MPTLYSQTSIAKRVATNIVLAADAAELRLTSDNVGNSIAIITGTPALYWFDPTDDGADDGAATIAPTDVTDASGDGRWLRLGAAL